MRLFVLMVFALYGGVHVYAFLRARSALGFGAGTGYGVALFMVVMTFAIFLIRMLEYQEYERPARLLSYLSYFWMALLFLFFSGSLAFDLLSLITRATGWITRFDVSPILVTSKSSFLVSLGAAVVICAYGYFEAKDIKTELMTIETEKLPVGTDKLTIAQISDVHLGLINQCERFGPMIKAVKEARPDIFIVSGDLVDAQVNHLHGLSDMLREVKTRYGNFAVMGNHEYYAGPEKSLAFIKASGLTLLRDEVVSAGPITIVGADDRTGAQLHLRTPAPEPELLANLPRNRFILFLKHQPLVDPATIGLFDLQLSGHTHKGQIFPFTLLTLILFPLNAGTFDLGSGSLLHVSRGTGTWGPPVRFLAPPEVTVVELVRKKAS